MLHVQWIIQEVKASGLRGRGGAGFSTGMKWWVLGALTSSYHSAWCSQACSAAAAL